MAPRRKTQKKAPEKQVLEDLTEIGLEVDGLQEIEVTPVEAEIESGSKNELIEGSECEQPEEEEDSEADSIEQKKSLPSSEKSDKDSETEEKKKQLESKSASEEKPSEKPSEKAEKQVRSVKPTTVKNNTSAVGNKKGKIDTTLGSEPAPKKEAGKSREHSVKPHLNPKDKSLRSTYGIFAR